MRNIFVLVTVVVLAVVGWQLTRKTEEAQPAQPANAEQAKTENAAPEASVSPAEAVAKSTTEQAATAAKEAVNAAADAAVPDASANTNTPTAPSNDVLTSGGIEKKDLLTENLPSDVSYGDPKAPVRITEYASLSCTHCKAFHDKVQADLQKALIDTGKVYFIYRHFPLNPPALRAAQLVECQETNMGKQKLVDTFFATQEEWAFVANEEALKQQLQKVAQKAGIQDDVFSNCITNKALEDKILGYQMRAGAELTVNGTPTIFINDKRYVGDRTAEDMMKAIEPLLKQ